MPNPIVIVECKALITQEIFLNQTNSIINSLNDISNHLELVSSVLIKKGFLESQWFAALIGAGSAILIFSIEKLFSWRRKKANELMDYCKWLNEQFGFRQPRILLESAHSTTYGHTTTDGRTGETTTVQEMPLGEKLIIELRRDLKWWRQPNRKLHRYFKEYEKKLLEFNELRSNDIDNETRLLDEAQITYDKIENYAYKITGENEYTY